MNCLAFSKSSTKSISIQHNPKGGSLLLILLVVQLGVFFTRQVGSVICTSKETLTGRALKNRDPDALLCGERDSVLS